MPVRYPPEQRKPPSPRRSKTLAPPGRIVHYAEPPISFWRRFARRFFSAPVIIPLAFVSAVVIGFLVYYWTVFSGRIQNLLKGEGFTRTAGIFSGPKKIRVGDNLSQEDLIDYLKRSGYVGKNEQADN